MAWLVSLKILLISSGVVALALAMKLYVPLAFEFAVSNLPLIYTSCKSLLRPPYLYVVINAIIITIAASSMYRPHEKLVPSPVPEPTTTPHHHHQPAVVYEAADVAPQPVVYKHIQEDVTAAPAAVVYERRIEEDVAAAPPVVIKKVTSMVPFNNSTEPVAEVEHDLEDEIEVLTATTPESTARKEFDDIVLPASRPLVSSRFGHQKPARSTPEGGRPLRVAKAPKRHETLESTWKAITEGRSVPLSRHMKKSDTWDHHHHGRGGGGGGVNVNVNDDVEVDEETSEAVNKSKTFKELTRQQKVLTLAAVSSSSAGGMKLRKEPSLGQDEVNRRVEAFIHKFNEDMRLQRQESLNQYMEMINRGSH